MDVKHFFGTVLMMTVLDRVTLKETTQEYNCCHLPFELPLNRSHDNEISMGNTSLVIATELFFNVMEPFKPKGNDTVILPECKDSILKITSYESGKAEELTIHNHVQPCNSTAPDNRPDRNVFIGVGIGVGLLALLLLVGVTMAVVCRKRENTNNDPNDDVL